MLSFCHEMLSLKNLVSAIVTCICRDFVGRTRMREKRRKTRRECYRIAVQLYNDRLIREFRIHETRFALIVRQFELIPSLHHPEMPSTVFNSIGRRHRIAFIPQILHPFPSLSPPTPPTSLPAPILG